MWPSRYFPDRYFPEGYWVHAPDIGPGSGYFPAAWFADPYFAPRYFPRAAAFASPTPSTDLIGLALAIQDDYWIFDRIEDLDISTDLALFD